MCLIMKQCFSSIFIFSLLIWGNHCILNDALASIKKDVENSSPCHNTTKDTGHHQKCEKNSCCQPLLKSDQATKINLEIIEIDNLFLSRRLIDVVEFTQSYQSSPVKLTTGPPQLATVFIQSLSVAPQAPPVKIVL